MQNIDRLTQLNAELEGLLHVLAHRDNTTVRELLQAKYEEFKKTYEELQDELKFKPAETIEKSIAEEIHQLSQQEVKQQEAISVEIVDQMDASVAAIERGAQVEIKPKTKETSTSKKDSTEPISFNSLFDTEDDEIVPVTLGGFDDETIEEPKPQPKPQPESKPQPTFVNKTASPQVSSVSASAPKVEMSVADMLSRKEAADLKRVFTLNDKIRFRRMLFNQDENKFSVALIELADKSSFDEAKALLLTKYGWDESDPDVEDFLSIIKPHYNK